MPRVIFYIYVTGDITLNISSLLVENASHLCFAYTDVLSDDVSSLDDKGSMERHNRHVVSHVKTTSLHQHDLSSSSDLDEDILPLFRRIQLQQKKLTDSDAVTHHKTTHKLQGTLEFPIVID